MELEKVFTRENGGLVITENQEYLLLLSRKKVAKLNDFIYLEGGRIVKLEVESDKLYYRMVDKFGVPLLGIISHESEPVVIAHHPLIMKHIEGIPMLPMDELPVFDLGVLVGCYKGLAEKMDKTDENVAGFIERIKNNISKILPISFTPTYVDNKLTYFALPGVNPILMGDYEFDKDHDKTDGMTISFNIEGEKPVEFEFPV